MLQIKAEIIRKRYINAELDLFRHIRVVCNNQAIDFIFIELHLLQGKPYAEYALRGEVVTIGRCQECGSYSVWGGIIEGKRELQCRHCRKQAVVQFYPPESV